MEKMILKTHHMTCLNKPIHCKYCELLLHPHEHASHEEQCGSKSEMCEKCSKYVPIKDFDNHKSHGCDPDFKANTNINPTQVTYKNKKKKESIKIGQIVGVLSKLGKKDVKLENVQTSEEIIHSSIKIGNIEKIKKKSEENYNEKIDNKLNSMKIFKEENNNVKLKIDVNKEFLNKQKNLLKESVIEEEKKTKHENKKKSNKNEFTKVDKVEDNMNRNGFVVKKMPYTKKIIGEEVKETHNSNEDNNKEKKSKKKKKMEYDELGVNDEFYHEEENSTSRKGSYNKKTVKDNKHSSKKHSLDRFEDDFHQALLETNKDFKSPAFYDPYIEEQNILKTVLEISKYHK